jgi:hypothetical protein
MLRSHKAPVQSLGMRLTPRSVLKEYCAVLRIGIISDTHGLLRPEVGRWLAGVAHIIHAGDVGRVDVLEGLRRIAPVTAIRGNIDTGEWAKIIRTLRSYGWAGEASTSCTIFRNCNSTRQGADLTWSFQATRIDRGSKLLTGSST